MKTSVKLVRILEQVKTSTVSGIFTDLLSNCHKRSPRFSPGFEDTEKKFYFLIIIRLGKLLKNGFKFNHCQSQLVSFGVRI